MIYLFPVNPDSNQKRKLIRHSDSTPRITCRTHTSFIHSQETSSRYSETFTDSACTPKSADVVDGPSIKNCAPVFFELGKKVALIDDNVILNSTTLNSTNVSERANVSMESGDNEEGIDVADFIEFEFMKTEPDTPKIVIDLSDLNESKDSDEVPLITRRHESDESGILHTSFSPLTSDEDSQVNGKHVCDTQL